MIFAKALEIKLIAFNVYHLSKLPKWLLLVIGENLKSGTSTALPFCRAKE